MRQTQRLAPCGGHRPQCHASKEPPPRDDPHGRCLDPAKQRRRAENERGQVHRDQRRPERGTRFVLDHHPAPLGRTQPSYHVTVQAAISAGTSEPLGTKLISIQSRAEAMLKPIVIATGLLLASHTANAAAYDDAFAAYQKGDYQTALKLMKPLAEGGNVNAQYNVGAMYNENLVKQDYNEAAKWFQKAAAQGNVFAQVDLGVLYEYGHGVQKDYKEALRLFRLPPTRKTPPPS
jgi:tetratricopeptide (TPR) repeat protein